MRCEACGSALPEGADFCPVCAAEVPARPGAGAGGPAEPGAVPASGDRHAPGLVSSPGDRPGPGHRSAIGDRSASGDRPAPGDAPGEPEWASPWLRLAAFLIDQALVGLPGVVAALVLLSGISPEAGPAELLRMPLVSLLPALGWVALWVAEARTGRTVGNLLVGIRTARADTLEPPGFGKVLVRYLLQGLGSFACYVGMYVVTVSGLWDSGPRRQGWHDKVAGTVVLRTRRGTREAVPAPAAAPGAPDVSHAAGQPAATTPPSVGVPSVATTPPAGPQVSPASAGVAAEPPLTPPLIAAVPGFSRPPADPPAPVPADAPAPVPAESAAPVPADPPAGAPEQPTVASVPGSDDVDRTRLAAPSEREVPVLLLPDGERLEVRGEGVLGRNPAVPVGEEVTHLVPLADPSRSVSKTHLGFGPDAVGLWVKDLHSTNGTAVVSPDGSRTLLEPGRMVHVMPGDVVLVGDVEIEVVR